MIFDWPELKTGTEVQATVNVTNIKLGHAIQKTATSWGTTTSTANADVKEVTLNFIKQNESIFKELSKL